MGQPLRQRQMHRHDATPGSEPIGLQVVGQTIYAADGSAHVLERPVSLTTTIAEHARSEGERPDGCVLIELRQDGADWRLAVVPAPDGWRDWRVPQETQAAAARLHGAILAALRRGEDVDVAALAAGLGVALWAST